jgi:DNA-directed RNA polymerase subunit RPC12/RpoP
MAEHFINLNCANCGAKLEVYEDMDRFACGHCGTEMLVQRRGGTVALKAVTEAIKKVQIGTDKTAAELAIARYESELKELRENEAKLSKADSANSCTGIGCGGIIFVVGLLLVTHGDDSGAGWVLVVGCVAAGIALFVQQRNNQAKLQGIRMRMGQLETQVARKKQIADS